MIALRVPPFNWHKEYAPHWQPGSTAFWLEPSPGDIRPGEWPMPFTVRRDLPIYDDEQGVWHHLGHEVLAFNMNLRRRGYTIVYRNGKEPGFISDQDLGMTQRPPRPQGYMGKRFFDNPPEWLIDIAKG